MWDTPSGQGWEAGKILLLLLLVFPFPPLMTLRGQWDLLYIVIVDMAGG